MAAYREALTLNPDYAEAHTNLGNALWNKGDLAGAMACYRKAIACKPDLVEPHYNLGVTLNVQGDPAGASAAFRKAIELKPDYAEAHNNLGIALKEQGNLVGAIAAYEKAIAFKPDLAEPRRNLVIARRETELEAKLPAYLAGKAKPANSAEQIDLANLCARKHLNHASARFFEAGFEAEPGLANDLARGHRYNAACAAVLAGCGQGKDSPPVDQKERVRLRQKAVEWLRADLGAWREQLNKEPVKTRPDVEKTLSHWLTDPDLSGVRDREALAKLPEAERGQWKKFWQEVAALRDQAASPK
jgi:tetratricopeptide (TPR) repeat protein